MPTYVLPLILVVIGSGGLLFLIWRYVDARRSAAYEYDVMIRNEEIPATTERDVFERAFLRIHGPRAAAYGLLSFLTVIALLPLVVWLIDYVWFRIWFVSGRPDVFAQGELIHSFILSVVTMACFAGIAALFMYRFHKRAPGTLNEEIEKEMTAHEH